MKFGFGTTILIHCLHCFVLRNAHTLKQFVLKHWVEGPMCLPMQPSNQCQKTHSLQGDTGVRFLCSGDLNVRKKLRFHLIYELINVWKAFSQLAIMADQQSVQHIELFTLHSRKVVKVTSAIAPPLSSSAARQCLSNLNKLCATHWALIQHETRQIQLHRSQRG